MEQCTVMDALNSFRTSARLLSCSYGSSGGNLPCGNDAYYFDKPALDPKFTNIYSKPAW